MKKYMIWIFLILMMSACSLLPVDIIVTDATPTVLVWTATPIQSIETLCPGCEATATMSVGTPVVSLTGEIPITPTLENTQEPVYTATAQIVTVVPTGTATATPTIIPATATNPVVNLKFEVQQNSPVYIPNFAHPEVGCSWMGIAGQVFSKAGSPMTNVVVVAEGFLDSKPLELISLTSLASAYGPGGYELPLAYKTIATKDMIFLSIYDLNGNLLSMPYAIETFSDCEKNLVVVNFKEK